MKPTLLVVGANPSFSDPHGVLTEKSASGRRLKQWLSILNPNDLYEVKCLNVSDGLGNTYVSRKNMELKRLRAAHKDAKATLALGHVATRALSTFTANFITLPHPSPRNRLLNNKTEINNKLILTSNLLKNALS